MQCSQRCNALTLNPLLANAMENGDQDGDDSKLAEAIYEILAWIMVFREQWPCLFGAIMLVIAVLVMFIGWRGMCLRTGVQLVKHDMVHGVGDLKVHVSVDLNRGLNQRWQASGTEDGVPAPGTPARPINCTSDGESYDEADVQRERAAKRGAKAKRKSRPSPRDDDDNDEVIDRRGTFGEENGAHGSAEVGPLRRPVMPDEDGWCRHRPGRRSGSLPILGRGSAGWAVERCMQ